MNDDSMLSTVPMRRPGESTADYRLRVHAEIERRKWRRVPAIDQWWLTWGP